ncbi:MAG: DUF5317 family protein [bacterium]|nr:DUF5317 family protein [bacterium]
MPAREKLLIFRSFLIFLTLGILFFVIGWTLCAGGIAVILAGSVLNSIAISVNGGKMPVHIRNALVAFLVKISPKHRAMDRSTRFRFLCDWIYMGECRVLSIGDLFIYSGGFFLKFSFIFYCVRFFLRCVGLL